MIKKKARSPNKYAVIQVDCNVIRNSNFMILCATSRFYDTNVDYRSIHVLQLQTCVYGKRV